MATSDDTDRRLAASGLAKQREGKNASREEAAAIRRLAKAREESDRWKYYATVPKKHYRLMTGKQTKTLNEQAAAYGVPCGGPVVDVGAVLRWLHDFLATHKHQLQAILGGAESSNPATRADVSYKNERMLLLRNRRRQQEGSLVSRAEVHEGLGLIAGIYRRAGERLRREFGDEAYQIVDEGWDDAQRMIERRFGGGEEEEGGK